MPKVTFEVPVELRKNMSKHKDVKWDSIVSDALWNYSKKIELLDNLAIHGKMTDEDAAALNRSVKKALASRYKS
jgi:hypothetical protein